MFWVVASFMEEGVCVRGFEINFGLKCFVICAGC